MRIRPSQRGGPRTPRRIAEALSGKGQYTVFAPTDDAFIALADFLAGEETEITDEEGALGVLTSVPELKDILLYHVARGRRDAEDVLDSKRIRTLNRGFVFPGLDEGGPFLIDGSGARVAIAAPDVFASNGVIHVIGGVLLPAA